MEGPVSLYFLTKVVGKILIFTATSHWLEYGLETATVYVHYYVDLHPILLSRLTLSLSIVQCQVSTTCYPTLWFGRTVFLSPLLHRCTLQPTTLNSSQMQDTLRDTLSSVKLVWNGWLQMCLYLLFLWLRTSYTFDICLWQRVSQYNTRGHKWQWR